MEEAGRRIKGFKDWKFEMLKLAEEAASPLDAERWR